LGLGQGFMFRGRGILDKSRGMRENKKKRDNHGKRTVGGGAGGD